LSLRVRHRAGDRVSDGHVAVGYHRNEAGARQTAAEVEQAGGNASIVRLDLADQTSIERAAQQVTADFGGGGCPRQQRGGMAWLS
jgi:uncharacterized protein YbjT (DUF2867 family)